MIQAVLFDMNGVIIDDEPVHEAAFAKILQPFGISFTHQDYLDCCGGQTDHRGFVNIQERFKKNFNIEEMMVKKEQTYLELIPGHIRSYEGVIELIKKLHNSYQLALVSSSSRRLIDFTLTHFEIASYFSAIVSADEVKKGKPDPEPYLMAAHKLHIEPQQCAVIEDSKSGVLSAVSAGMFCVAVKTTHPVDALGSASIIADDFESIAAILEKIS